MNNFVLTEAQEGANLAEWLDLMTRVGKIKLYTHVPNSTYTTSWAAKRRNRVQGVKPGMTDYIICTEKEVIFLELKRVKGGQTSNEQKEWLLQLNGKTTVARLAKGADNAIKFIEERL